MELQAKNGWVLGYAGSGLERAIEEWVAADQQSGLLQISEVPEEIRRLITKVNRIVAVMKDAERRPISSHEVRLWLQEAKQILLDAEDLFDELATDAAVQKMRAHTKSRIGFQVNRRWIREMNGRLDLHLASQPPMLGLQLLTLQDSFPGLPTWRETSSFLPDEASVIGRDREKDQIIQILLSSDDQLVAESSSNSNCFSVHSIVGLGGVGKTTLAQLVFNDQNVKKHFDLMMWVCVSHDADRRRVAKDMIEAALAFNGKYEQCQVTAWNWMQRRLLQEVEGKIFLLVLDDVWDAEHSMWEELFKPLHSGKKGSKVLVTARNSAFVSKLEGRMVTPLLLEALSDADSWVVLKKYAFRGNMDADVTTAAQYSHLEDLGRRIVPRLKGSPLAARTIGSLLNLELSEEHWKTVLESEFWKLPQGENDILPALLLSYQYLRADLKQCFTYCSLFPKDHMFSKEEVVQLWEAQSFMREGRGERMKTMGSKYFNELLRMSFFELDPRPSYGNVYVMHDFFDSPTRGLVSPGDYVMHDLIHDLAEYVSKDDCFRLEDQNIVNIPDTVHHMSVYVSERGQIDIINKLCFHEKLRTLLFQNSCHLNTRDLDQLFLKLKMLRILGLRDCGITELPNSIGDLKHLRYIDLQVNRDLTRLPESLGNLYNLQVLNLKFCWSLHVLPSTMCQLVNLRRLQTNDCDLVSSVDGLGKLTGLQELAVRGRKVRELGGMCMLRELKVINLEEVGSKEEASQARLHTMEHLQVLRLSWSGDTDITSTELEEEVLQAMRPSDGIRELYIHGYRGIRSPDWMEASIFTSFSSLRCVSLSDCPSWQVPICSFLSQLHNLEYLDIERMGGWEEWSCHESPIQKKRSCHESRDCHLELTIIDCPKLKELPTLPRTLRRLKLHEVGIYCLPELDGCSCAEGGMETSTSSLHLARTTASVLSRLDIPYCDNLTSISRLRQQQLPDLEVIEISYCKNLMSLPEKGFGHLVSLKRLRIAHCRKLTCLQEDEVGSSQHLPCSLVELEIEDCGYAMGGWWWAGLQRLTSIARLSLRGCPTTADLLFDRLERHHHPHLPVTLRELEIDGCNLFYHHQESTPLYTYSSSQLPPPTQITHAGASSAGAIRAFTSLEELTIRHSSNFLNKWGGSGLPSSLERLTIVGGNDADQECLSTCLPDLISLKQLTLVHLQNLHSLPNLSGLTSLETLRIRYCPSLQSWPTNGFPSSLQTLEDLISLKELALEHLENLHSLPNLSGLTSLETLRIEFCRSIQSWPTNGLPSSLQTLEISECPALTEEHKDKPKSMWPEVVAHIPEVMIDRRTLR